MKKAMMKKSAKMASKKMGKKAETGDKANKGRGALMKRLEGKEM